MKNKEYGVLNFDNKKIDIRSSDLMVTGGLEPPTLRLLDVCSTDLATKNVGFEPESLDSKSSVQPTVLHRLYVLNKKYVIAVGGARTHGHRLKRPALYRLKPTTA